MIHIDPLPEERKPVSFSDRAFHLLTSPRLILMEIIAPFFRAYEAYTEIPKVKERRIKKDLRQNPADSHSYCKLGNLYKEMGDLERAVTQFETALAVDKECARAYLGLVTCTDDEEKKLEYLRKAAKIKSLHAPELRHFVYESAVARKSENPEHEAYLAVFDALGCSDACKAFHKQYIFDSCMEESTESVKSSSEKALEFYRNAMEENPDFYREFLVKVLKSTGHSREEIDEELAKYPKNEQNTDTDKQTKLRANGIVPRNNLSSLGDWLLGDEFEDTEKTAAEFDAAVEKFEQRMAESPFDQNFLAEYATYLAKNWLDKKYEFVASKLEELIRKDPSNSAIYLEYGRFLFSINETDEAIKNYLIAYENPDFSTRGRPPYSGASGRTDSCGDWNFYYILAERYSDSDPGKAAIAFERGLNDTYGGLRNFNAHMLQEINQLDLGDFDHVKRVAGQISGRWSISPFDKILIAQAIVKGERFSDINNVYLNDMLKEKVQAVKRLKEEGCRYLLARELNSLGLYDEAIQTLDGIQQRGASEYFLFGDSHESKWRKQRARWEEGEIELLEKAHEAYAKALRFEPKNMNYVARLAHTARLLGRYDEITGLWMYAKSAADGTCAEQLDSIKRCLGNCIDRRKAEALQEKDLGKRIDLLEETDDDVPDAAKFELTAAYIKYAPILAEKMGALLD